MPHGTSDDWFATLTALLAAVALVLVLICLIGDVVAAFYGCTFRSNLLELTKVLTSLPAVAGGFALVFHKPIAARLSRVGSMPPITFSTRENTDG